jgi:hypothetical protein
MLIAWLLILGFCLWMQMRGFLRSCGRKFSRLKKESLIVLAFPCRDEFFIWENGYAIQGGIRTGKFAFSIKIKPAGKENMCMRS